MRWAVEFLSKYSIGDDGRTPYERIRQETFVVPIMPFGEMVFDMPLSIVKRSKGEPAKTPGIYLGTNERTEETVHRNCEWCYQMSVDESASPRGQVEPRGHITNARHNVGTVSQGWTDSMYQRISMRQAP